MCPPCTGFTQTNPQNHLRDDCRNGFVSKAADFAVALDADIVVIENARELIRGNFRHHYRAFRECLEDSGYSVFGRNYLLNRFGLPQVRERAIVIASKEGLPPRHTGRHVGRLERGGQRQDRPPGALSRRGSEACGPPLPRVRIGDRQAAACRDTP